MNKKIRERERERERERAIGGIGGKSIRREGLFLKGSCGWGFCLSNERKGRRKREKCLMGSEESRREDFDFS